MSISLSDDATPQVQICFGQVRHRRLRPVTHQFTYGVFFLRLPLRRLASGKSRTPFFSLNRFNLLSFHEADHGDGKGALSAWIDTTLQHEGVLDADGEIWLQTFPRVLGYVFNPVSFWFCHRRDGSLRAVLCEVRNTFGEKHCYLLDAAEGIANGSELVARKIFHVSPFCATEGEYRFRFLRNAGSEERDFLARIDHYDAQGALLITSVTGVAQTLNASATLFAFLRYPLQSLGIMLKIHWQALRLWHKKVPFFSKPTPPVSEISR